MKLWKKKRRFAVPCPGCLPLEPSVKPISSNTSASGAPYCTQMKMWSSSIGRALDFLVVRWLQRAY